MTPGEIIDLVDQHHAQTYPASCAGSLCEMMLKREQAIAPDCFDFQKAAPSSAGGVSAYVGKKLPGGYTMRKMAQGRDWELPFAEVHRRAATAEAVGVFARNPGGGFHGWLVAMPCFESNGVRPALLLVAKASEHGGGEGRRTLFWVLSDQEAAAVDCSDPVFLEKIGS